MKSCTHCGLEKPISDFGMHKSGKSGIRARCKQCEVQKNTEYRKTAKGRATLSSYRNSQRGKGVSKAANKRWLSSEHGKAKKREAESRYPERRYARNALTYAISKGRVIPWPVCAVPECNDKPEAHHPDYDRPLDVVWLCRAHHRQVHECLDYTEQKNQESA